MLGVEIVSLTAIHNLPEDILEHIQVKNKSIYTKKVKSLNATHPQNDTAEPNMEHHDRSM